jgi:hemolysin III
MIINKEELANALIHGIGAVFFMTAAPVLFLTQQTHHASLPYWPLLVFLSCLLMTYVTSTVYHAITEPEYKKVLRVFDHVSIFLLI